MIQSLWKTVWQFLKKLNILLPYDPAITLPGNYQRDVKSYVHTKTCTQMFIAALFMIAKTWKPTRCRLTGEWVNKLLHPMKYYTAIKIIIKP